MCVDRNRSIERTDFEESVCVDRNHSQHFGRKSSIRTKWFIVRVLIDECAHPSTVVL